MKLLDYVRKYGWEALAVVTNLGIKLNADAHIFFVDVGATEASDADDEIHGMTWETPFASIDYAVGKCTANQGDVILVAPGHYEDLGDGETIDFDIAGITVIGLGNGTDRPRIDYNHANATIDVGANNVRLNGLTFRPSAAAVLIGIDIEANKTGCIIENCEFMAGEAGDGTDEFVVSIDLKSGNTETVIRNNIFRTHASCNGCTTGIMLTAASLRVQIVGNYATGNWSTAFIDDGAACTDLLVKDNIMKVKDGEPGIELHANTVGVIANNMIESTGATVDSVIVAADCSWFNNYAVVGDGEAAELIGGGEFGAMNLDHLLKTAVADTSDPVDLTAEVVDNSILSDVLTEGGDTSDYDRRRHSLEAISRIAAGLIGPGGANLCAGTVFYVDSATGTDDAASGTSWADPLDSLDYAIGKCTADAGDVILLAPGHAENIAAAGGITFDVAGVTVIGLGSGTLRPTFTFITDTGADIEIDAANVTIKNCIFVGDIDGATGPFDVDAAHFTMENCVFRDNGTDNAVRWILGDANADYMHIKNCVNEGTDTAGNTAWITLNGADHVTIEGCVSHGDFSAANIEVITALCTDLLITGNHLENANAVDVNIELFAGTTGWVSHNLCRVATDAQTTWINTPGNSSLFENYGVNNNGETGILAGTPSA